jgi:hypothetical protein
MNCFNIRELQGILKRKFFVDLIDSHDYKDLLKDSMVNLRYKTNSSINLDFDTAAFYKFGIHNAAINKNVDFTNNNSKLAISSYDLYFLSFFTNLNCGPLNYISSLVFSF